MFCCENCFRDDFLIGFIRESGNIGNCKFCGSQNVYCIPPAELTDLFEPIVNLYTPIQEIFSTDSLKEIDYNESLADKLSVDWEIFNDDDLKPESRDNLLNEILRPEFNFCVMPLSADTWVENEDSYFGYPELASNELWEKWDEFCEEIRWKNRFFTVKNIDLNLLGDLLNALISTYSAGQVFYRSRICHEHKKYPCSEMGKPPSHKTKDGRANPKGISYLYISSEIDTAIAESKIKGNGWITIAKFALQKPLKIIDLRNPRIESPFKFGEKLNYYLLHLGYLKLFSSELSETVNSDNEYFHYLPLQYLCEFIKSKGFDGVAYKSSRTNSDGYNLAIFNDSQIKCRESLLYRIYNFKMHTNFEKELILD